MLIVIADVLADAASASGKDAIALLAAAGPPSIALPSRAPDYVRELTTADLTEKTATGWPGAEPVIPDAQLVRSLSHGEIVGARRVRAVAFLHTGVHPTWIVTFADSGERVDIVATRLFWGEVGGKRASTITRSRFQRLVQDAEKVLARSDDLGAPVYFAAIARWESDGAVTLHEAEPFSPAASRLERILRPFIAGGRMIYSGMDAPKEPRGLLEVVEKIEPAYPVQALARGQAATVIVQASVGPEGRLQESRVVTCSTSGSGFEEAALEAVRGWRWTPALCAESATRHVTVVVTFDPRGKKKD